MKTVLGALALLAMFSAVAFSNEKPRILPYPHPPQPQPHITPLPGDPRPHITPLPSYSLSQGQYRDVPTAGNRISFSMSGLDITRINKGYFVSVKGETPEGREVSFVMGVLDTRSVRLISHRVDSTCAPKPYCEAQDVNTGPRFEPSRRYDFELFWNGTFTRRNGEVKNLNNQVWMEVFEANTKNSLMQWTVPLFGPMRSIKWARVGNGVEEGYGGMNGVITLMLHH